MRIDIITIFPEWFSSPLNTGLFARARVRGLIDVHCHNPRNMTTDRHHTVDDRPYGGGAGMVLLAAPLSLQLRAIPKYEHGHRLIMSANGRPFTQNMAQELAKKDQIVLVCGRYEGIDARVEQIFDLDPICVGEVVLNGGEAAALMVIEAITRLLPGFMGKHSSMEEESFSGGLLEYPQFSRPDTYEGLAVPEVLLKGNHKEISRFRREQSLALTWERRPEMLDRIKLDSEDLNFLRSLAVHKRQRLGRNLHLALIHYPVFLERPVLGKAKSGATSLTNLDIHDIARTSCSYGLAGVYMINPLRDQKRLLQDLLKHWIRGQKRLSNPDRALALELVRSADNLEDVLLDIEAQTGQKALVVGTSARTSSYGRDAGCARNVNDRGYISPLQVRKALKEGPVLLLLGTGHGLTEKMFAQCDAVLRPIRWLDEYNHLPVRSAAAIVLDRIFGDRY